MADPKDIYRAAQVIIYQHGERAEEWAKAKMRGFMDAEDVVAASAWLMIAQAIDELQQRTPTDTVH